MEKITKKILIGVIILLVVYFGYELYLKLNADQSGYYDFENGKIQEQIQGDTKIITEEGLGLIMKVPSDWEYQAGYGYAVLKDPDIDVANPLRDFKEWTKGCSSIEISIENDQIISGISNFDEILEEQESFESGDNDICGFDYCEIVNIQSGRGIKKIQDFDGDIQYIDITILGNNRKIFRINTLLSAQLPECENHLNDFINSLEFK